MADSEAAIERRAAEAEAAVENLKQETLDARATYHSLQEELGEVKLVARRAYLRGS